MGALVAGFGFTISVCAWWLYFRHFDEHLIDRLLRVETDDWLRARERGLIYVFSHLFVHAGIVASGVGVGAAIEATLHHQPFASGGLVALCLGTGAFLLGTGVCHRMTNLAIDNRVFRARVGLAILLGGLAFVGRLIPPALLVGLVALAFLSQVVYEELQPRVRRRPSPTEVNA
jgi:low temperature requirement protein LtrA